MTQLRRETDAAIERADAAEAMNKIYEQQILEHEQKYEQQILKHVHTVSSLTRRLGLLADKLNISKSQLQTEGAHNTQDLAHTVQFLEKSLKEAEEK